MCQIFARWNKATWLLRSKFGRWLIKNAFTILNNNPITDDFLDAGLQHPFFGQEEEAYPALTDESFATGSAVVSGDAWFEGTRKELIKVLIDKGFAELSKEDRYRLRSGAIGILLEMIRLEFGHASIMLVCKRDARCWMALNKRIENDDQAMFRRQAKLSQLAVLLYCWCLRSGVLNWPLNVITYIFRLVDNAFELLPMGVNNVFDSYVKMRNYWQKYTVWGTPFDALELEPKLVDKARRELGISQFTAPSRMVRQRFKPFELSGDVITPSNHFENPIIWLLERKRVLVYMDDLHCEDVEQYRRLPPSRRWQVTLAEW